MTGRRLDGQGLLPGFMQKVRRKAFRNLVLIISNILRPQGKKPFGLKK